MSGRAEAVVEAVAGVLDRVGIISAERFDSTMSLAWPRIVTGFAIMSKQTVDLAFVGIAVGTAGTATVDTPGTVLSVTDATGYDRPDVRHWPVVNGEMDGAVRRQMDRFAKAVAGDGEMLASLADGAHAQAVADAISEAIDAETAVTVDRP